jgi:hypothetical protein
MFETFILSSNQLHKDLHLLLLSALKSIKFYNFLLTEETTETGFYCLNSN